MKWIEEIHKTRTSVIDLWNVLQDQWTNIAHTVLEKLVNCMPKIIQPVLPVRGGFHDEQKIFLLLSIVYFAKITFVFVVTNSL